MFVYADSSAIGKLFLEEPESAAARRFLAGARRVASAEIARLEVHRALLRAGATEPIFAEARLYLAALYLAVVDEPILRRAERIGPRTLRTLDALHLATALDFSPLPDFFLCYDQRLADAARLHGLAVVSPGLDEVHEP